MTTKYGEVRMVNGPSFNLRTPWTSDPTGDDYAIADAREEAWIKGNVVADNLPFTFETMRAFVARNYCALARADQDVALGIIQTPDATNYQLFAIAIRIQEAMSEARQ